MLEIESCCRIASDFSCIKNGAGHEQINGTGGASIPEKRL